MKLLPLVVLVGLMSGCAHLVPWVGQKQANAHHEKSAGPRVVYCDTDTGRGQWSDAAVGVSQRDKTTFHGPFEAHPVAFSLVRLPAHHWVRVRFNLLALGKWDGSSRVWGPDLISLSVHGGTRLLWATLGNCGFWNNNNEQSYPDEYPWAVHPGWTGAVEKQVEGLRPTKLHLGPAPDKTDSVYSVDLMFPHTDGSLTLDFAGIYDDAVGDQAWGVRNLEVTVIDKTPTPADALPGLWADLASVDPVRANQALWKMVGAGDAAKTFIAARVAELNQNPSPADRRDDGTVAAGLRLHRAHRVVRIIGGPGSGGICFALDHLFPEY